MRSHVRWVHFHEGMARPQVADGGDGLQMWRVTENVLNKHTVKNKLVTKIHKKPRT
jgi:hypothetical protein